MPQRLADWMVGASAPGAHAAHWAEHPEAAAMFRPAANLGVELSQVPADADVGLLWLCPAGHTWTGTPSVMVKGAGWKKGVAYACPKCARHKVERHTVTTYACGHRAPSKGVDDVEAGVPCPMCVALAASPSTRAQLLDLVVEGGRARLAEASDPAGVHFWQCASGHRPHTASVAEKISGFGCQACS